MDEEEEAVDETWDQTAIERVEPELAAMEQAEMVWDGDVCLRCRDAEDLRSMNVTGPLHAEAVPEECGACGDDECGCDSGRSACACGGKAFGMAWHAAFLGEVIMTCADCGDALRVPVREKGENHE